LERDLNTLFGMLEAGFYAVPEMQRYFVWTNSQIRDLIDSIYNWYPIGGIIVWEMPKSFLDEYKELVRPLAFGLPEENIKYMVIDGQQRLTSLLLIKRRSIRIITSSGEVERKVELFFNPIDEIFELGRKSFVKDPNWFNVTDVLNAETVYEILEEKAKLCGDDRITRNSVLIKKLDMLRDRLRRYPISLIEAKFNYSGDLLDLFEKISRIFVTINSKGTRIRMPDLVLALVGARVRKAMWVSFRDEFNTVLRELEEKGFKLSESVITRLYLAVLTGTTKLKDAREELDMKSEQDLFKSLKEAEKAMLHAIDFLWREAWIPSSEYLQSNYLLVTLSYLLHKDILSKNRLISEDTKRGLIKWLILASVNKRYTGRLETDLFEDVSKIAEGKGVNGLLDNLRLKSIPSEILEGSYDKCHLTLLLASYRSLQTRDWDLNRRPTIPLIGEIDPEELQIHHIFPRDLLEKEGKDQFVDDVANITIISNKANKRIGNKPPSIYLKELYEEDPELLKRHLVPTDAELWNVNNYEQFLKERRELILKYVANLL
jgi:hypothetical protein